MTFEQYRRIIEEKLPPRVYRHSLEAAEAAVSLAERYGASADVAYIAGLLHDYGKAYNHEQLLKWAEEFGLELDWITLSSDKLLHAPVGAVLVKKELGITDQPILDAVAYHTTGRSGMSLLEKVIYLSDYVEPGRTYEGVDKIKQVAAEDLDKALLAAVDSAICSVVRRRLFLHPRSIEFRNSLLQVGSGSGND